MPRIKKAQPAPKGKTRKVKPAATAKAPKIKTVLSPADQERIDDLTGGSARSLREALEQWDNERAALAALHDENTALSLYFRRMGFLIDLMAKVVFQMENDIPLFMTPAVRKAVDNYKDQLNALKPALEDAKEIANSRT
jgi:hypothetical protein